MRLKEGSEVCADPCMHDWYESCRLGSKPGPAGLHKTEMTGLNDAFVNKFLGKTNCPSLPAGIMKLFPKSQVIKCVRASPLGRDGACRILYVHVRTVLS